MAITSRPYDKAGAANHERIFGKHKKCQKGKIVLDNGTPSVVKCTPRKSYVGHPKEGVASHVVPHTHQRIVYKGSTQDFKDEIQRAYDNHPDPAFRGKVHLDNL